MNRGILLAFISAIFIGFAYPFNAVVVRAVGPLLTAVIVGFLTTILFTAWLKLTGKKLMFKEMLKKYRKEVLSISVLRMSIGVILLFFGLKLSTATNAGFLSRFEPLFVLLIGAILLKRKLSLRSLALTSVILIGAFLMSTGGSIATFSQAQLGDIMLAAAVFFFAYVYFPSAKLSRKFGPLRVIALTALIGSFVVLPFMLAFTSFEPIEITNHLIYSFIGYMISFPIVGFILWYKALETIKEWIVSMILSIAAVSSAILAYFWLGEVLGTIQMLGAGVILVASILAAREMK